MAKHCINLTIARVLGGDADNNNSSDIPFQIDLLLDDKGKEKKTASATPFLSNKKSRLLCDMNITTPAASETSATTTSSSAYAETQAQLVGFSIPTFCLKDIEGSPLLDKSNGDDCHLFEENNEI